MSDDCMNVYQKCRVMAGLTGEQAAERLNISVRALRAYEAYAPGISGGRPAPDAVVDRMCEVYGTMEVVYRHLSDCTLLGQKYLPKLDFNPNLSLAFLRQRAEWDDMEGVILDQMQDAVMDDGVLTEDEFEDTGLYFKELMEAIVAGLELIFQSQKMEKSLLEQTRFDENKYLSKNSVPQRSVAFN